MMEQQEDKNEFTELQALLKGQADALPHCDLEDGFLQDFHLKLRSESLKKSSLSLFWERLQLRAEEIVSPSFGLGGLALATVALALGLGFHFNSPQSGVSPIAAKDKMIDSQNIYNVKADQSIDFAGTLPSFSNLEQDF